MNVVNWRVKKLLNSSLEQLRTVIQEQDDTVQALTTFQEVDVSNEGCTA
jgi:hypothetical protein